MERSRFELAESAIPTAWYNVQADLPEPLPPVIHPGTKEPIGPEDLAPLFPMELIKQEVSQDRYVDIPETVRDMYRLWRPTPLVRARRLEQALDTPAHLYYKYEGVSPVGSHKPNTAVPQAYYNREEGITHLTTETGAGQWGSAMAMACAFLDLECEVYMVRVSYDGKPYQRTMMESYGAQVTASPSSSTAAGKRVLEGDPDSPGSLGIAISEAVEAAVASDGKKKYCLGSVLNHVLMHQTVIGQEALAQFEQAGEYPDVVVGCTGGGSSFGDFVLPLLAAKISGERDTRFVAVEPAAAPSLTAGRYTYDFGDEAATTPLIRMHTLGHGFVPAPIHAGGLRYHGMAPIVSHLYELGLIEAVAVHQIPVFDAAQLFTRTEGIVPAPAPSHALRVAIDEALRCNESGESKVIAFNLCDHGHFDMKAYRSYLDGELVNYEHTEEKIAAALEGVPAI